MTKQALYEVISNYDSRIVKRDLPQAEAARIALDLCNRTDAGAYIRKQG
ncbi:hypothetical protein FHT44_005193 [Mycolicibacterium sp. BK634]|nr:hypothetical protein [Mycolicibacterium sp. BK634]